MNINSLPFEQPFSFDWTNLIIFEMYYHCIAKLEIHKQQRIRTCLVALLAMVLIGYFANSSQSQIIKYSAVIIIAFFSYYLVINTKKEGFAAGFCVLLGCITIMSGILISNAVYYTESPAGKYDLFVETTSQRMQILQTQREFLHLHSLFIGTSCIGLGMVFAYRPSLIQIKDHLPFEYPYPVWNSKRQSTQSRREFVLAKSLLTEEEKLLSCRFKYILVLIDGQPFLISPNEKIPSDSIIMRTRSGKALCGISRI